MMLMPPQPQQPEERLSVRWCGREIVNPDAPPLVLGAGVAVMFAVASVLLTLSPLLWALHRLLRMRGRQGMVLFFLNNTYVIDISPEMFRKLHE